MNKRGDKVQSGAPAAALIGIITLMFIFYILFLPPSERKSLLEGENATIEEGTGLLLDEAPGLLTFTEKGVFDHSISNIYLIETKNAVILGQENPFIVKKGWFSEQQKSMVFSAGDLDNTENVMLSFQASERKGTLVIALNGQKIFEGVVSLQNPPPVALPKTLLRPTNQIDFSVTGGFFSSRKYSLSDIKVIADITDVKKQISQNTFTISDTEKENLDSAFLDFYPICEQRTVGTLTIELNGKVIYAAAPACESLNRQDLYGEDLRNGKNTLVFRIDKGSYRVEQIRVRTVLKAVKAHVEFFNVKTSLYNDILDKNRQVILRIEFIDDNKKKRAELNVDGRKDMIDQTDDIYERDISTWVKEGNNYIEIKPLTELDVVKLQVRAD
jgi:hypothetical protein